VCATPSPAALVAPEVGDVAVCAGYAPSLVALAPWLAAPASGVYPGVPGGAPPAGERFYVVGPGVDDSAAPGGRRADDPHAAYRSFAAAVAAAQPGDVVVPGWLNRQAAPAPAGTCG
jgi:hypothetical protein